MLIAHGSKHPEIAASAWVAPDATVCGDVIIGPGTRILYGARLIGEGGGRIRMIAALITAVGGLLVAVHYGIKSEPTDGTPQHNVIPGTNSAREGLKANQPGEARDGLRSPPLPPINPHEAIVILAENDGTTLTVSANSLVWELGHSPREFTLSTGQSIPFDKIKTIDVLEAGDLTTTVQATLTDSRTLKGPVDGGRYPAFSGESDIGHVRVGIGMLRQIRFQR